jgi:outer membrane murein-binding lipoprotein Lpp
MNTKSILFALALGAVILGAVVLSGCAPNVTNF